MEKKKNNNHSGENVERLDDVKKKPSNKRTPDGEMRALSDLKLFHNQAMVSQTHLSGEYYLSLQKCHVMR